MSFKKYLLLISLCTVVFYISLGTIIQAFDPAHATIGTLVLFYVSICLSFFGTLLLAGLSVRYYFGKETLVFKDVLNSLRQAVVLTLLLMGALLLKKNGLLAWWNIALMIILATFAEMTIVSYKTRHHI